MRASSGLPLRLALPFALVFALSLAGLPVASAQASPRGQTVREDGGARLFSYDSLCDEDNAVECLIAEIGCAAPGEFTALVYNLDAREAGSVFAGAKGREGGKGSLAMGATSLPLQVSKVMLSEHSYNWNVTLLSLDRAGEIWRAAWSAPEIELRAGTRRAVIRRADFDEGAFREVVSTCAVR